VRLRLAAIGDVAVIGSTRERASRDGWDALFSAIAPVMRRAELGFANLEMPIGRPEWVRAGRSPEFWQAPEVAPALVRAGVHVVSLANNHVMDCGPLGLAHTLETCTSAGLLTAGAGENLEAARRPAEFQVEGRRVRLLAYATPSEHQARSDAPGLAPLVPELVREDLTRSRDQCDVLVVSAHWGSMYVDHPPPRVLEMARVLIEAGADVVLGSHPHVMQGFRRWTDGSLVLYSLGDAVFNARAGDFESRTAAELRRESGVFEVEVADTHGLRCEPLILDSDGVPTAPPPVRARAIRDRLDRLSRRPEQAAALFEQESASRLLQYELESVGHYLRSGRWDRVLRLLGSVRPRHLRVLWQGLRRWGRRS
jgi:poly-gamma-glutamate synthesis protein (capsule biosynthesis protein)